MSADAFGKVNRIVSLTSRIQVPEQKARPLTKTTITIPGTETLPLFSNSQGIKFIPCYATVDDRNPASPSITPDILYYHTSWGFGIY